MEIEEVIKKSHIIDWYKPDECEVCGQGAMLCHDPRCPDIKSINEYERKRERKLRRTFIQKIAAKILNED